MNISGKMHVVKYHLPVYLWMVVIFLLSSTPQKMMPPMPYHLDYVAHLIEYAILGALLVRALLHTRLSVSAAWCINIAFLIGAVWAMSDEFHQYFVPGRCMALGDLVIDLVGTLTGSMIRITLWPR